MHRADQLLRSRPLEQEARCTGAQGVEDVVVLFEGGQDQHSSAWRGAGELSCRRDAVEIGHADIHQHDVGIEAARSVDGFPSRRGLSDDLHRGISGEELDQAGAHEVVVVGDQHPRHVYRTLAARDGRRVPHADDLRARRVDGEVRPTGGFTRRAEFVPFSYGRTLSARYLDWLMSQAGITLYLAVAWMLAAESRRQHEVAPDRLGRWARPAARVQRGGETMTQRSFDPDGRLRPSNSETRP